MSEDRYACGHLKPGSAGYTYSKYAALCQLPRGHAGNHKRNEDTWPREQYACGHIRPESLGPTPVICEQNQGHTGNHEHYGGFRWPNKTLTPTDRGVAND